MKKNVKNLLAGCLALLFLPSCAVISTPVNGFSEQMIVLKEHFPELYDLHSQGKSSSGACGKRKKEGTKRAKKSIRSSIFKTTFARAIRNRYKYLY